jgi:hypothetical protein
MSLDGFGVFTVSTGVASESDRDNSLDGVNTVPLKSGAFGWVQNGAAALMLFRLDREDDTTPADGVTVIAPLTGPGRWKAFGGSGAGGCVVRTGFDCPVISPTDQEEICLAQPTAVAALFLFPRQQDVAGNPLSIDFPVFAAGNVLTWNWALDIEYAPFTETSTNPLFSVVPAVELNGAVFVLGNYGQTVRGRPADAGGTPNIFHPITGQAHLALTEDQLAGGPPKVHLAAALSDFTGVNNQPEWRVKVAAQVTDLDTSLSLQASELQAPCVFQQCPTELIDVTALLADPPFCGV